MSSVSSQSETTNSLRKLYKEYRDTADIKEKGLFLSPSCHQICRPIPSFAARNKDTILQKMHEAAASSGLTLASSAAEGRGKKGCTIRPLRQDEFEFGTDDQVAPAGFASAEELSKKAQKERWVGMRVDMWNDEGVDLKGLRQGMLVKVRYWWREENGQWTQTLHDLLYIGQLDGTEGSEGDRID